MIPGENVIPLETRELKTKKEFWADFKELTKINHVLVRGIDKIAPGVFAAIERDLDANKISATSATQILTRLLQVSTKLHTDRMELYKTLKSEGIFATNEISAEAKGTIEKITGKTDRDIQKMAESALGDIAKLKVVQSNERRA